MDSKFLKRLLCETMTTVGLAVAAEAADNLWGYRAIDVCSNMFIFLTK